MIYDQSENKLLVYTTDNPNLNQNQVLCSSAKFWNELNDDGWDKIKIKTYKECPLKLQMWSAGYLEGLLTYPQINDFYANLVEEHDKKSDWKKLQNMYEQTQPSIQQKIQNLEQLNEEDKQFWIQVGLSQLQLEGLMNGANVQNVYNQFTMAQMYLINSDGQFQELLEILDLERIHSNNLYMKKTKNLKNSQQASLNNEPATNESDMLEELYQVYNTQDLNEVWQSIIRHSLRCSAFFKVVRNQQTEQIDDIVFAHSTWDSYSEMLRFFKHYDFALMDNAAPIKGLNRFSVSFSSYPGIITSSDDFFMVNNSLIVTETSIDILNKHLYKSLLPFKRTLPDSMRIIAANRLSSTSEEWKQWVQHVKTGTYNSIWMVLDLNKAQSAIGSSDLPENTLIIIEQIPTSFEVLDVTDLLLEKNAENVQDLDSLKNLMLLNPDVYSDSEFESPPSNLFKLQILEQALAQRFDLYSQPFYAGMIDTKCSNIKMAKKQICHAINGPSHVEHEPFSFSEAPEIPQKGMPTTYDFDWVAMDLSNQ